MVRAFLEIGLGNLRRVAGPLGVLSALPGLPFPFADLPSAVQRLTSAGALQGAGAIGLVLSLTSAGALAGGAGSPEVPPSAPADQSQGTVPRPEADPGTPAVPVVVPTSTPDPADEPVTPAPSGPGAPRPVPDPPAALPALPTAAAPSPDGADGVNDKGSGSTNGGVGEDRTKGAEGNRGNGNANG